MPTDADFLAAIAAAPHDRLPRLVYADWLDERADPRGELIRLEEETRERVAWDDVLWKLKPRRNDLRRQTDADWLKAMDYGQSCEPLFRGQPFPTDVRDAWRLIREAHERWTGEPMPDVGGHQDKVAEAEKRLGLTLPPSVREYIAFAHDLPQQEDWLAIYRDPYRLEALPGHQAVTILMQAERDLHWAIQHGDFDRDDPPVYTYVADLDEDGWRIEDRFHFGRQQRAATLTRFLFDYAFRYGGDEAGSLSVGVQDVNLVRSQLRGAFPFCADVGGVEHYETTNLTAVLQVPGHHEPGWVAVSACRSIREDQLPVFIREWCRAGADGSGLFWDMQRRFRNEQRSAQGLPPLDDIPF